jgi:hypothetical protein
MRTDKDYPFPLPVKDNKAEFLNAIRNVSTAVAKRKGTIKDYYEQSLSGGGTIGAIVVEEDVG